MSLFFPERAPFMSGMAWYSGKVVMVLISDHRYKHKIPPELHRLNLGMGPQLAAFRFFAVIKITAICQVHIYCGLSVKINACEMLHGARRSWMHFVCIPFHVHGRQTPEHSQLELRGWWRPYIWVLVSPSHICVSDATCLPTCLE